MTELAKENLEYFLEHLDLPKLVEDDRIFFLKGESTSD